MSSSVNSNLITNLLNQILGVGFPIIIQFYVIRHFELSDIGYLNLINSFWAIFALILSFFNYHLIRLFSSNQSEKQIKTYISNTLILLYGLITIPFIFFSIYLYLRYNDLWMIIFLTSLPVITAPLSFEIYFQSKLKNDFILKRRIAAKICLLILIFLFAKSKSDFILYVCFLNLILVIENLFNFWFIKQFVSLRFVNLKIMNSIIKNSFKYLVFNLTYKLLPYLSIIFASYFISIEEIAIYSILLKIVTLSTTFITSSALVLYPSQLKLSSGSENKEFQNRYYFRITLLIAVFVSILLIVFHKIIFKLFLSTYSLDGLLWNFSIMTLFIVFHSLYNYLVFHHYFATEKIYNISKGNIILIIVFLLTILLSKLNILEYNFATFIVIPYIFVALWIYHDINKDLIQKQYE